MDPTGYIEILEPGLHSSIQDLGRTSYLSYGVPLGGAMDRYAHKLANLYLQNEQSAATLEITLIGPLLRFSKKTQIVITGADLSPRLNDKRVSNSEVLQVGPQDELSFGSPQIGVRAYLGIKHGFQTPEILGARGWTAGVTADIKLEKGMKLAYFPEDFAGILHAKVKRHAIVAEQEMDAARPVGVFAGPEFHLLSNREQVALLHGRFKVGAANDRMGMQLEGKVSNGLEPIITGPVLPGSVQLTPSGRLIVLMRDCQTTGGYPRVLQLTENGINQMAQKTVGDKVHWQLEQLGGVM